MLVETDDRSGFCFGVQNAVEIAERALLNGEKVFSLGHIVHNDKEVERLAALGLESIDHKRFRELRDCKVLIRAHGEPPETYETAERNNITIIEATCPIVKKLQYRIMTSWKKALDNNGQVVIFGKPGHAEVIGLLGQTGNKAILISKPEDTGQLDFTRPVTLFSQTTMSPVDYSVLAENIRSGMREAGVTDPESLLDIKKTICGQVSNREPHLREFSRKHDIIVFVSGKESSNGKMLFAVCKEINPDSYFVSSPEEIDNKWFAGKESAGVCGATSTPRWLIEKVRDYISAI